MPIKIFATPGDHRNDFEQIESQANAWIEQNHPKIISMHTTVNKLPTTRETSQFMMTLLVHYDKPGA